MVTDDQVLAELLASGIGDWVSLHDVVWLCTGGAITPVSKTRTLRVLERVYSEHLMVPGDLGESGFEDWPQPNGWLTRSETDLNRLDWRPMGDGFWLRLTKRGEQRARRIGQR